MTVKDAIWTLQYVNPEDPEFSEAVELALTALRAQAEAEQEKPLTLEELRQMAGEPVWVVGPEPGWALVNVQEEALFDSNTDFIPFDYYGIVWQAYRRKPEEVRHG